MGKASKETLQKRAKMTRLKKTGAVVAVCLLLCNTILLAYFNERKRSKIEVLTKENAELNTTVKELRSALDKSVENQKEIMQSVETMVGSTKTFLEGIVDKE